MFSGCLTGRAFCEIAFQRQIHFRKLGLEKHTLTISRSFNAMIKYSNWPAYWHLDPTRVHKNLCFEVPETLTNPDPSPPLLSPPVSDTDISRIWHISARKIILSLYSGRGYLNKQSNLVFLIWHTHLKKDIMENLFFLSHCVFADNYDRDYM